MPLVIITMMAANVRKPSLVVLMTGIWGRWEEEKRRGEGRGGEKRGGKGRGKGGGVGEGWRRWRGWRGEGDVRSGTGR